jgi:hypothetical protein
MLIWYLMKTAEGISLWLNIESDGGKMSVAYDYQAQKWVEGAEGTKLRLEQLAEHLELLKGPRGEQYSSFIGYQSREAALEACKSEIGFVKAQGGAL